MKLLLDECVVNDLKGDLLGHDVTTVVEAGFGGLENGELLRAAVGAYDVLITVDRGLLFQQNISSLQIAIVILIAPGIKYSDLKPVVPQVLTILDTIEPGQILVTEPSPPT